jgi:hypothetical protein
MNISPRQGAIIIDLARQILLTAPLWLLGGLFLVPVVSSMSWHFILRASFPVILRAGVFVLLLLSLLMGSCLFLLIYEGMRRRYPKGLLTGGEITVEKGEFRVVRRGRVIFCKVMNSARLDRGRLVIEFSPPKAKDCILLPASIFAPADFNMLCSVILM